MRGEFVAMFSVFCSGVGRGAYRVTGGKAKGFCTGNGSQGEMATVFTTAAAAAPAAFSRMR